MKVRGSRVTTNPFDDESGEFVALVNAERQYSVWPTFAPVPDGWTVAHGPAARADVLAFVDAEWTDMRPASLVARSTGRAGSAS
jgi:MbtH protein